MMRKVFWGILLLVTSIFATGQGIENGIYFTIDESKTCERRISLLNSENFYCIETEPIIGGEKFESISEIYQDERGFHLDIKLTQGALQNLNRIMKELPKMELAITVKGRLIGMLNASSGFPIAKVTISEERKADLRWIYSELVASVGEN